MNKSCWLSTSNFLMGTLVGACIVLLLSVFLKTKAYAQGAAPKTVQFVRTAIMTDPSGQPGIERWQDPETKVVCYVTPNGSRVLWHEVGFSCVK